MILGLTVAGMQTATAGDREWAVVGKVLTGMAAAAVISHTVAVDSAPASYSHSYSYTAPGCHYSYCPPRRVVYAPPVPPPVVVYRAPVRVARAPVFVAPRVSVHVGIRGEHRHPFRQGCR